MRAHTTLLPDLPDLLAEAGSGGTLWRHEHGGIACRGEALRIELPRGLAGPEVRDVVPVLSSIPSTGEAGVPGSGPLAVGALPFDPNMPGHLIVPRRVTGCTNGQGWLTVIEPPSPSPAEPPPSLPPDEFTLTSHMPHPEWLDVVAGAVEAIRLGQLDKVVVARRVDIAANRPFVLADVLERLVALYPSCMVFAVDGFIGASPELLIRREGDFVESHPLAGTVARSGDVHGDEALVARLLSSPKARHEHQVLVDAVTGVLAPLCLALDVPAEPSVMGLRNVSHLATHITGRLGSNRPTALELVAALHPTPAVGGSPSAVAVEYIEKVEGFDRGCYAGPVGWVDSRGDGAWALGIRSALVSGASASIYAGNGIVAGSDPREELAETQLKLQALLAALVRP